MTVRDAVLRGPQARLQRAALTSLRLCLAAVLAVANHAQQDQQRQQAGQRRKDDDAGALHPAAAGAIHCRGRRRQEGVSVSRGLRQWRRTVPSWYIVYKICGKQEAGR